MNELMELLDNAWAAVLTVIGFLIWLVRLESRVTWNARNIERAERQRASDIAHSEAARKELLSAIKEIQRDIRALMTRPAVYIEKDHGHEK